MFFLNGKTGKLHFTSISELWMPPPPPRMKLSGNQQLECLQGHIFFQAEAHIYISKTLQVTIKKVVYHIIFIVVAIFCGYLEVLGIWMYMFENITLFFVHFAGLGTFTRFPHSITLTKVSFGYKNCDFGHIPEVDRLLGKEDTPSH